MFNRRILSIVAPVILGLAFAGCGGGGGGGGAGALPAPPTAPTGLSYSASVAVYIVGEAVPSNAPSLVDGTADSFSISPALPAGLAFDTDTGEITGTPTADAIATVYTVTATNSAGSTSVTLTITVVPSGSAVGYADNPASYFLGLPIVPNVIVGGASGATYAIDPALPSGLAFDGASGLISGTPNAASALTVYTVTESDGGTINVFTVELEVLVAAPANLTYPSPLGIFDGIPFASIGPNVEGSPVDLYSIAPALPAGLELDAATGVISGLATVPAAAAFYTITAANAGGSATFDLLISVEVPASCVLVYADPMVFSPNIEGTFAANVGCALDSFEITPALPAGLALDPVTGEISGTATEQLAATSYTVNAIGSAGFVASATFDLVVDCGIEYETPVTYIPGIVAPDNVPLFECEFDTFTVDPALPAGLSLDAVTGVLSGTPTDATPAKIYTITATNSDGLLALAEVVLTIGPIYEFVVNDTTVEYPPATGDTTFTVDLTLTEHPDNPGFPHDIAGFQMGLSHDPAVVDVLNVLQGADLSSLNGGGGADFFLSSIMADGFTVGVVSSITLVDLLLADTTKFVVEVEYQTESTTLLNDALGLDTQLIWTNDLGEPPVANLVSVEDETGSFGVSQSAVVIDGVISLIPE